MLYSESPGARFQEQGDGAAGLSAMVFRICLVTQATNIILDFRDRASAYKGEVAVCEGPEAAVQRIQDEKFDAIFVDADVPNFSRAGFVRTVRNSKLNSRVPITLLRTFGGTARAAPPPTDYFILYKPLRPADLESCLRDLSQRASTDRRNRRRLPLRLRINCVQGVRRFVATSLNLSEKGMLLELRNPAQRGDQFDISFSLPNDDHILHAVARVARLTKAQNVGVVFHVISNYDLERLRQFLSRLDAETPRK
jgi:DNA-binding LytR/AlgR family response regulator